MTDLVTNTARKLARARRLSLRDWRWLAESWVELARADLLVSAAPYGWWRDRVAAPTAGTGDFDPRLVEVFRMAAANHVRRQSCLRRAIALRAMLERRGVAVRVVFGARLAGDGLDAHAWLEAGGELIDPSNGVRERYDELVRNAEASA